MYPIATQSRVNGSDVIGMSLEMISPAVLSCSERNVDTNGGRVVMPTKGQLFSNNMKLVIMTLAYHDW